MKKLTTAICTGLLGAAAFAQGAQAGIPSLVLECEESGNTSVKDYFCSGTELYEAKLNCLNLDGGINGGLVVFEGSGGSGTWSFFVVQGTEDVEDYVCDANGYYGDSLKTEMKCTDAPTGSNKGKPGNGNIPQYYDQADFEIKSLGYSEECEI